ncbi:hypothetical protein C1645_744700 [Glomus cerebriforme]|uniref:Uncharacterized protein n=1 Tax=Glomus cerebriforme TaxID=658196 RepID=A0A397S5D5_9GLOM|nr:hypothetical protein C1645_744700 [Glomus cerebriforme]
MVITKEIGDYPKDDTIVYKQKNERGIVSQNFTYKVITAGNYPDKKILQVTRMPNCYSIPNNYKIQTSWGRGKENKTVQCIITYHENKPLYQIQYGRNFTEQVSSGLSATNATDLLYNNFTKNKTRVSGILLFSLQLNKLKEYREIKSRKKTLKPVNNMSTSGLTKRATKVASKVSEQFSNITSDFYLLKDTSQLESISFSVKEKKYVVDYGKENQVLKHKKEVAIVRAMDKSRILRDGYRYFAAIEPSLPREKVISEQKISINNLMEQNIKINVVDITTTVAVDPNKIPHIIDENVIETVINSVGKAGVRSIKEILIFLIPNLIKKNILNPSQPLISI